MDKIYGTAILTLLFLIIPCRSRYGNAIVNPTMKFCLLVSLALSFFFFNKTSSTEAAPIYADHDCPNTTLFSPNSAYRSNVDALLSALSSAAANSTNGFANATVGQNPPDQAYGIFFCHGYHNATTCSHCMATAKQAILQRCRNRRVSTIWYDECMLRYSNQSIFSVMEHSPVTPWYNYVETTDPVKFAQVLNETIEDVGWRASGTRFATGEANVTTSEKLYLMAQCTPDLKSWDCNTCLRSVISQVPLGISGGTILTPSCNVRLELYPFYDAAPLTSTDTVAEPPLPPPHAPSAQGKRNKLAMIAIAIVVPARGLMLLLLLAWGFLRRKGKKTRRVVKDKSGANELTTVESLQFDLATIEAATNDFSPENKLGEGGFGEVFQGKLLNGQQIAVKRLSRSSRQGDEEFKNEVLLVAKLQHRNLVRLLGFCLEGDEKLLTYEFVPNKSLDYFLYDPTKKVQLNWPLRYKIISGIARGILYLHEDSCLRIIHRDLKCSNILLDSEMNPKISDFGMARIFGVDQTQANTKNIVGTFGYMSPEYAMQGEFSVKSDVYSFGILLIEIICGKRNGFYQQLDGGEYLAGNAWHRWKDGTPLKVLDPAIVDSSSEDEVLRCLHISLLCIQEDPIIRPTMATVVLMLSGNYVNLPLPQHPPAIIRSRPWELIVPVRELEFDLSIGRTMPSSTSSMSITEFCLR